MLTSLQRVAFYAVMSSRGAQSHHLDSKLEWKVKKITGSGTVPGIAQRGSGPGQEGIEPWWTLQEPGGYHSFLVTVASSQRPEPFITDFSPVTKLPVLTLSFSPVKLVCLFSCKRERLREVIIKRRMTVYASCPSKYHLNDSSYYSACTWGQCHTSAAM